MEKIIVISGASSGIGFETAKFFHEKGFQVVGLSRSYPKEKYDFDYLLCDISKEEDVKKVVKEIEKKYKKVDILVNCAGIGISGAVEYTPLAEAEQIFQVNVIGQFLLTRELLKSLRKSDKAKIINIGSVAGALTIPFQTFYSMTKASIHAFSEGLKMELKPFKIDVSCVLPGDTKTGFTKNRYQPKVVENEVYKDRIKNSIQRMEKDEQNGMPAFSVVKVINKLVKRRKMPVMVTVGFQYKLFVFLNKILPKNFVNWILYKMYG
jgi:short-subunit dehydrogenase